MIGYIQNLKKYFMLFLLRATLKRFLRTRFLAKNAFSFFIEISDLTLKYHHTTIPNWKNTQKLTQKQDPMTFWRKSLKKIRCPTISQIWGPRENMVWQFHSIIKVNISRADSNWKSSVEVPSDLESVKGFLFERLSSTQ